MPKTQIQPLLVVIPVFIVLLVYVLLSCGDMIQAGDQSRMLSQLMAATADGSASWWDGFWAESAGHRQSHYFSIVTLNYWLFCFNTVAESITSCLVVAVTLWVLLLALRSRTVSTAGPGRFAFISGSVCLVLLSLSLIASNMFNWSIGVSIFNKNLAIILAFAFYHKIATPPLLLRFWELFVAAFIPVVLVFVLGGYIFAFIGALCSCVFLRFCRERSVSAFSLFAIVVVFSLVGFFIYNGESAGRAARTPLPHIGEMILFILQLFGNSVVLNAPVLPDAAYACVGLAVISALVLAFFQIYKGRAPDLLAAGLIAYSLLFALAVAISRLPEFGISGARAPRYIPDVQLGIVGAVLHFAACRPYVPAWPRLAATAVVLCLALPLVYGIQRSFVAAPYKKRWAQDVVNLSNRILFDASPLSEEEVKSCRAKARSVERFQQAAELCMLYGLSGFRESNGYGDKIYLQGDWSPLTEGSFLLRGTGTVSFRDSSYPALLIRPSVPSETAPVLRAVLNGQEIVPAFAGDRLVLPSEIINAANRTEPSVKSYNSRRWHKILLDPVGPMQAVAVSVVDSRELEIRPRGTTSSSAQNVPAR